MFWTDISRDQLLRGVLDGSSPTVLISSGIPCIGMILEPRDYVLHLRHFLWYSVKPNEQPYVANSSCRMEF